MNELRFDERVAIITGAGGGLGRAYAHLLAARGAAVVVNDLGGALDGSGSDSDAAAKVVYEIQKAGGNAIANTDSVTTADGGEAIVQSALDTFGRLDILVNNAGILRDTSFHKMTARDFEAVVSVHLMGTFYVTHPAYKHMREAGYGRIVVTTSGAGWYGNFGQANYAAAKLGVVGMARSLALEGFKRGVHTNAISPAAVSRMTANIIPEQLQAVMVPEAVAPVVAYLAHESCELNGETLSAFGGHVGNVFAGETIGIAQHALTPESVAENLSRVLNREGYLAPETMNDVLSLLGNVAS